MTRRTILALAAAGATAAAVIQLGGPAQSAPPKPNEHFRIYSGNVDDRDMPQLFRGYGPIRGIGLVRTNDDGPGNTVTISVRLPGGALYLSGHGTPFQWRPDLRTCTATDRDTGTFRITGGTGRYRHAHGSGHYTEVGSGIGERDAHGVCQQHFAVNYVVVYASGRVRI